MKMTSGISDNLGAVLEKKIGEFRSLQKRAEELLQKRKQLKAQMSQVDQEIEKVIGVEKIERAPVSHRMQTEIPPRPTPATRGIGKRGTLTKAVAKVIDEKKEPMNAQQIAEKIRADVKMVRNILYTSRHFERVGRAQFTHRQLEPQEA